jgi:LytS/YehU family sensor histidine kinase
VPVSLQILIENAIKHNEISNEKPLYIEITDDNEYLIIKNNLQPRNYLPESNHLGLKNLQFQYEILSGLNPLVVSDDVSFIVKLSKIRSME